MDRLEGFNRLFEIKDVYYTNTLEVKFVGVYSEGVFIKNLAMVILC